MKKLFYTHIYQLLLIISNQFNNRYINKYKLFIGTSLLLTATGCQEVKKKSNEDEKDDIQVTDTVTIEKENEDSILCYNTATVEEAPQKRRKEETVNFSSDEVEEVTIQPLIVPEEDPIVCYDMEVVTCYVVSEYMPFFPGGTGELMRYITSNLKYPANCIEKEIEGRVVIQFIINRQGQATNPKTLVSPSPLLEAEVIKMIDQMPRWKPGQQHGKPVAVKYTIPVMFKLIQP